MQKNNILDIDDKTREKRIENLVNASELIYKNITEKPINESSTKEQNSFFEKIFYPFIENMPPLRKYSSTGYITNIKFNHTFEKEIKNKDVIELDKNNIFPKWVSFTIKLKDKNREISKKFKLHKEKDKFNNFVNYYGNKKLDSLIGSEVILKPDYEYTEFEEYDVIIPDETFSSKIKTKLSKFRTDIAPRSIQPNVLGKYFALNIIRLVCTLLTIFITIFFMTIFFINLDTNQQVLILPVLVGLNSLILIFSAMLQDKINNYKDTNEKHLVGDIERSLFTYVLNSVYYIKIKLHYIDSYIGKKL